MQYEGVLHSKFICHKTVLKYSVQSHWTKNSLKFSARCTFSKHGFYCAWPWV